MEASAPPQQHPMLPPSSDVELGCGRLSVPPAAPSSEFVPDLYDYDGDHGERLCRLCFEPAADGDPLIAPCLCGSSKWVHRSCLDQWRYRGMLTNRQAMTQCPSCMHEYEVYCTCDIREDRQRKSAWRWQLVRYSCCLCLSVQCFELVLAAILALLDRDGLVWRFLKDAQADLTIDSDLRRWYKVVGLTKQVFFYYTAAVLLSLLILGVASFIFVICCRGDDADASQLPRVPGHSANRSHRVERRSFMYSPTLGYHPVHCPDCDVMCWSCWNCDRACEESGNALCSCCGSCQGHRFNCEGRSCGCSGCNCNAPDCGNASWEAVAIVVLIIVIAFIIFGLVVAVVLSVSMLNNSVRKYVHVLCLKDVAQRYAVVDRAAQEAPILTHSQWNLSQEEIRLHMHADIKTVMGSLTRDQGPGAQQEEPPAAQS